MNRFTLLTLLSLCYLGCTHDTSDDTLNPQMTPHDFMFMQRAYPTGNLNPDAIKKANIWKKQHTRSSMIWEFAGPENIGGRITDIEIPVDNEQVYYVGTASGGIFKTEDSGNDWYPIFDQSTSLSIGDMEISKTNTSTIWVGTGEVNAGGGSLAYNGDGIHLSTDGGLSWVNKGLNNVGSISKIWIDPNDENTIFASAMGPLFSNDSNRGVYKSTDNGDTWNKILFVSDSTGVIDMVGHPVNSDIIYTATWERIRRPQYRKYGGSTSGIYRSSDGGDTWDELTNGLPTDPTQKGRISIAISQSNPDVLYARYADATGFIQGVYKTDNGGDQWYEVNSSDLTSVSFHWWFRGLYVDPTDENILYNVDFITEKSIDGGNSWFVAFPGVHVDQHALAFNTMNNNEILLGNDGGLYRSLDKGDSHTKFFNLPITQFYRIYVDPQNGDKIYGGSQDNNTIRTTSGQLNDWYPINGGDGFQPLVDANNTNTIYALSQYGNLRKSVDDGNTFINAKNGISGSDRTNWDTPVVFDPQDSETLYFGTQRLWKTTNGADEWSPISPDLTNGSGGGNLNFGTITTIDVSPHDRDFIIVGTDDANIWVTQDGGANWKSTSSDLPNLWTTKVLVDREDTNTIYVTFSGYRYGEGQGHVFRSRDVGDTWEDIGSGLPDIPINDIVEDVHGNLYLATDIGVFMSHKEDIDWVSCGENIPSVVITDLHIHEADEFLFAATYGRSAYKLDIRQNPVSTSNIDMTNDLKVYPNPASDYISISNSSSYDKADVLFYNSMGKAVYEKEISMNDNSFSIAHLSSGTYFVHVSLDGKSSVTKLIVD